MGAVIANVPMPTKTKAAKAAKVKAKKVSKKITGLRALAKEYKKAYKAVYGMEPQMTYDGKWIRIKGLDYGIDTKRLKEMIRMLQDKQG